MSDLSTDSRAYDARRYLALAECGIFTPDDRIELLEGLIVSMPPSSPKHASTVNRVQNVLQKAVGSDVNLRIQLSFLAGDASVPEPDVAIVPGNADTYVARHPSTALLVVEVSESSVVQDRLTKSRIYAGAGIPNYWIVNLRDDCVEVFRAPHPEKRVYTERTIRTGDELLAFDAFPEVAVRAGELLPPRTAE